MSDPLHLTWDHDPKLLSGSLSAWWESAVPRPSIRWRLFFWAGVWLSIFAVAIALGAVGLPPSFVAAGLVGIGVFIIGFFTLQRVRMRAFYKALGTHWDVAGQTHATLSADGILIRDKVSEKRFDWPAIDAVAATRRATVLRSGIAMISVPDRALPDDLSAEAFRARLDGWRGV